MSSAPVFTASVTKLVARALPLLVGTMLPQSSPAAASFTAFPSSSNTASSSTPPPGLLANDGTDVAHQMSATHSIKYPLILVSRHIPFPPQKLGNCVDRGVSTDEVTRSCHAAGSGRALKYD